MNATPTAEPDAAPHFPLWQIDGMEYEAVCAYLAISPEPRLYARLTAYLGQAAFRFARPRGFALYLAQRRLTRFRVARLDLASKLLFRGHPIRHVLNAVIALHECDGKAYRQLATTPAGWRLLPSLLGWLLRFAGSAMVTAPWLGWQLGPYLIGAPFRGRHDLTGKRVLVTGVNRGLGHDLMLHCLERGAHVIGTVRNAGACHELLARLPAEAPVRLLATDLSKPGALASTLKAAGIEPVLLDIAILSAAVKHDETPANNAAMLRDTFQVNVFSAVEFAEWLCASGASTGSGTPAAPAHSPSSPDRANGRSSDVGLVIVSSIGRWHGMRRSGGYNASKAALSIWAESLELDTPKCGSRPLKVTIVEPGMFASRMVDITGPRRLLLAPRRSVARRIVSAALAGRRSVRPPFWFALLTWTVCLGGRNLRRHLFAGVRRQPEGNQ